MKITPKLWENHSQIVIDDSINYKVLVAWEDNRMMESLRIDIYRQFVNEDVSLSNSPSDNNFVISKAVNYEYSPLIGFNSKYGNVLSVFST